MNCPYCDGEHVKVNDSRDTYRAGAGRLKRRRRECKECFKRWTTYEITEESLYRLETRLSNEVRDVLNVAGLVTHKEGKDKADGAKVPDPPKRNAAHPHGNPRPVERRVGNDRDQSVARESVRSRFRPGPLGNARPRGTRG